MAKTITASELRSRLTSHPELIVVDVRMPFEYRSGHIPGAVNIPLNTISDCLPGYSKSDCIVVVCQAGTRSQMAIKKVRANHENLLNLEGGTGVWIYSGFDVVKEQKQRLSNGRLTHLIAGLILVTSLLLGFFSNPSWFLLACLPTLGLLLNGLTGICPMSLMLQKVHPEK